MLSRRLSRVISAESGGNLFQTSFIPSVTCRTLMSRLSPVWTAYESPRPSLMGILNRVGLSSNLTTPSISVRFVSTKQRRRWKIRKYHFKLRLKRTMRKMRVPYMSSKSRGQVKKKPILYDFRPYLRRKLKRAER